MRVTGVKVEDRSGPEPVEKSLEADLVVDAAGRGSRCLTWLESLGFPRPEEEHIKMNLATPRACSAAGPKMPGGTARS